jgi:hypothetical protein
MKETASDENWRLARMLSNLLWLTVSKALEKSARVRIDISVLFMALSQVSLILIRA